MPAHRSPAALAAWVVSGGTCRRTAADTSAGEWLLSRLFGRLCSVPSANRTTGVSTVVVTGGLERGSLAVVSALVT